MDSRQSDGLKGFAGGAKESVTPPRRSVLNGADGTLAGDEPGLPLARPSRGLKLGQPRDAKPRSWRKRAWSRARRDP